MFNIIEFSKDWNNSARKIMIVKLWKKKETKIYTGENAAKKFFEEITTRKERFYILDPITVIPEFLKWSESENLKIEIISFKATIYSFSVKKFKEDKLITEIYIQNIIHLLGDNIDNLSAKTGLNYTYLPYWNILRTQRNIAEEFRKKWIDMEEESRPEENNERLIEAQKIISSNTETLFHILKLMDKNLSKMDEKWKYRVSIASVSINIFLSKFNWSNLKIENSLAQDSLIRGSYLGGRCEVFGNFYYGEEIIVHKDFKNMYGEILKNPMPTGSIKQVYNNIDLKIPGFYYIKAFSDIDIPVLPHKRLKTEDDIILKEDLIFSNGIIEGLYYYKEIELHQLMGQKITDIKYGLIFEGPEEPIFADFAITIIGMRENDKNFIWKKILVALYGRMGMRPAEFKTKLITRDEYSEFKEKNNIIEENWILGYCLAEIESTPEEPKSVVQYASIITSLARIKLYKEMIEVMREGGRLLYCDTDSIYAAYPKKYDMKKSKIKWDSTPEIEEAVFASIRNYSLKFKNKGWETKIAGTTRNSINFENFKENFYSLMPNPYQLYNYKENLKNYKNWNTWKEYRTLDLHQYKKRTFSKDKKKTKAITLIENTYFK